VSGEAVIAPLSGKPVSQLSEAEAKGELAFLAKNIAHHDTLYYQDDAPEISDADYDALRRANDALEARFPELVRPDSPSARVGAAPSEKFEKVRHAVAMLSLSNAMNDEEVREFVARVRRFFAQGEAEEAAFTAEPKIDGLSISLRYENGHLVTAATRGDGAEAQPPVRAVDLHQRLEPEHAPRGGAHDLMPFRLKPGGDLVGADRGRTSPPMCARSAIFRARSMRRTSRMSSKCAARST